MRNIFSPNLPRGSSTSLKRTFNPTVNSNYFLGGSYSILIRGGFEMFSKVLRSSISL
jgi:hypothetical protein